jgi:hypothetical protein
VSSEPRESSSSPISPGVVAHQLASQAVGSQWVPVSGLAPPFLWRCPPPTPGTLRCGGVETAHDFPCTQALQTSASPPVPRHRCRSTLGEISNLDGQASRASPGIADQRSASVFLCFPLVCIFLCLAHGVCVGGMLLQLPNLQQGRTGRDGATDMCAAGRVVPSAHTGPRRSCSACVALNPQEQEAGGG